MERELVRRMKLFWLAAIVAGAAAFATIRAAWLHQELWALFWAAVGALYWIVAGYCVGRGAALMGLRDREDDRG